MLGAKPAINAAASRLKSTRRQQAQQNAAAAASGAPVIPGAMVAQNPDPAAAGASARAAAGSILQKITRKWKKKGTFHLHNYFHQ